MKSFFTIFVLFFALKAGAQSIELMPGTERLFTDVQWFKTFESDDKWSFFSRTTASLNADDETSFFSIGTVNYTTESGFGATLLGRLASFGSSAGIGIHYLLSTKDLLIFSQANIQTSESARYSWFVISRFRPRINDKLKLYSGLELISNFNNDGHVNSIQRIRFGLDIKSFQFGFAINLSGIDKEVTGTDTNPGFFLRKEF